MLTVCTALAVWGGCAAARRYLDRTSRRETEFWGGRVRLTALWNRGAAFGLPMPERCLSAASGAVLAMLWCDRRRSPIGAGLALGGGLSNLRERFRRGRVYDYVRFPRAPRPLNRYVFNLADFAILAGGLALLMRRKRR